MGPAYALTLAAFAMNNACKCIRCSADNTKNGTTTTTRRERGRTFHVRDVYMIVTVSLQEDSFSRTLCANLLTVNLSCFSLAIDEQELQEQ